LKNQNPNIFHLFSVDLTVPGLRKKSIDPTLTNGRRNQIIILNSRNSGKSLDKEIFAIFENSFNRRMKLSGTKSDTK